MNKIIMNHEAICKLFCTFLNVPNRLGSHDNVRHVGIITLVKIFLWVCLKISEKLSKISLKGPLNLSHILYFSEKITDFSRSKRFSIVLKISDFPWRIVWKINFVDILSLFHFYIQTIKKVKFAWNISYKVCFNYLF